MWYGGGIPSKVIFISSAQLLGTNILIYSLPFLRQPKPWKQIVYMLFSSSAENFSYLSCETGSELAINYNKLDSISYNCSQCTGNLSGAFFLKERGNFVKVNFCRFDEIEIEKK